MNINTTVSIVLIVFLMAIVIVGGYFYARNKTLNDIRKDVYKLFLIAEHKPDVMDSGKKKMKWVLQQARYYLPGWLQPFISDAFLEKLIESWFRAVKDLLDDGKMNKSHTKEE